MHGAVLRRSTSTTIRETEGGAKEHKHHHPRDGRWCLVEKPTEIVPGQENQAPPSTRQTAVRD